MKKEFRKHSILITVLAGALMLSGCGGDDVADRRAGNNNIDAVMEQQMQAEDAKKTEERKVHVCFHDARGVPSCD